PPAARAPSPRRRPRYACRSRRTARAPARGPARSGRGRAVRGAASRAGAPRGPAAGRGRPAAAGEGAARARAAGGRAEGAAAGGGGGVVGGGGWGVGGGVFGGRSSFFTWRARSAGPPCPAGCGLSLLFQAHGRAGRFTPRPPDGALLPLVLEIEDLQLLHVEP